MKTVKPEETAAVVGRVKYFAPLRKWEATGNFTADGKPMFSSREWGQKEKLDYERNVLGLS